MKRIVTKALLVSAILFGGAFLLDSCKPSLNTTKGRKSKVKSSGRIGAKKDVNRGVWGK